MWYGHLLTNSINMTSAEMQIIVVRLNKRLQVGDSWFGKKEVEIFLSKSISWVV